MTNHDDQALKAHAVWRGKLRTQVVSPVSTKAELSLAYTPGVAAPCVAIANDPQAVFTYTGKGHTVAVITDGSAVLGLGNIGPLASLPVMEGKCALFKAFGDVDAVPIALDTQDPQTLITTIKALAPAFGGINLEDISAPRCVEIERALVEALDIPVFHDDQHGTAIVVSAALRNALKLVHKDLSQVRIVISGAGAAGSAIVKMLHGLGACQLTLFDKTGQLHANRESLDFLQKELLTLIPSTPRFGSLAEALKGADVFIGVSAPKLVSEAMVGTMANDPIVFALANPTPEISYDDAIRGGAAIAATGRSDRPNQVNNVLAFPGLFKGALSVQAQRITPAMMQAAVDALANLVGEELSPTMILPMALDPRVADTVALAVARAAEQVSPK
jgi:malate dehydrogenase (oxaloacetate-decarboxylating)